MTQDRATATAGDSTAAPDDAPDDGLDDAIGDEVLDEGLDVARRDGGEMDDLARQGLDLRLACQRIARRVRYESSSSAVPPHQFAVLARLDDGALAPGEIAELERVSAPSMTRTVSRLEEEGLVARTKHPTDGRIVLVALTDEGRALLDEARHRRDLWMTSRLRQLDEADIALVPEITRILTSVAAL